MSYIMCYNKIEEGTNNMIIIRGSEYQDFLQCRKKWYYSWYEKIEPKRKDNKLFFGTLFHKWLNITTQTVVTMRLQRKRRWNGITTKTHRTWKK